MADEPRRTSSRLRQIQDTSAPPPPRWQRSRLTTDLLPPHHVRPTAAAASRSRHPSGAQVLHASAPGRIVPSASTIQISARAVSVPANTVDAAQPDSEEPAFIQEANTTTSEVDTTPGHVADYWYALSRVGGVFRLDGGLFVLQDWDIKVSALKLGAYVHLVRLPRGPDIFGTACNCAHWKATNRCLHSAVLDDHVGELMVFPVIAPSPLPPAVFLHQTPFNDVFVYSCISSPGRYESGKRVIVSYQRDGRWHCQSCRYAQSCKHVPHAVEHAALSGLVSDTQETTALQLDGANDTEGTLLVTVGGRDERRVGHISYQRVRAPRWCALPQEDSASVRPPPDTLTSLPLDALARCACGTTLSSVPEDCRLHSFPLLSTLFRLTHRSDVQVQVLPCPTCNHCRRLIGPDLGNTGVFNWNNVYLFTHELLNAYTNAYTASETPFSAFCLTMRRQYEDHAPGMQFCSDETFVRAWFAFVQLQDLESSMKCPTCGPAPRIVIADGVSLATHASKLTPFVRPPTLTDSSSEVIESISTHKARGLPAIPQRDIRSIINRFLDAATSLGMGSASETLPDLVKVQETCPAVASLLVLVVKAPSLLLRRSCRELARQIAAPDVVLQLVPYAAIGPLRDFARTGTAVEWLQALVPALGRLLNAYRAAEQPLPSEIPAVAGWLADRAETVYTRLAQHDPAPVELRAEEDWRKTGTCYGLPAVRARRLYTRLRYDNDPTDVDPEEMGDCKKFFKAYPRNKLAGGILVLWCTHSICLGFHTIPISEGRNDVFSAIYTRFVKAPEIIVYDFACQLAPYSLVREARYFRQTRFLIDEFHARDHTKCGQACFASNSMQYDERVRSVNTSAAECGNQGLGRIRKSVSYMTYEHAVIYTKTFLDIWNRSITRRMLANT
ncbi:hypothetical protein C8Q77DRAFT_412950 [Trametes polyzona]|nr:hypothetical protein C8Q77DRAFT_412950 [Trametes polyzona]